jgi:hypothetical protein
VLRTTNRLLADFLAVYYSVHRDMEQHPEPFSGADFLPQPDENDDEDAADEVADTDVAPVHPMLAGGVVAGMPPMRGHGSQPPAGALAAFAANAEGEG